MSFCRPLMIDTVWHLTIFMIMILIEIIDRWMAVTIPSHRTYAKPNFDQFLLKLISIIRFYNSLYLSYLANSISKFAWLNMITVCKWGRSMVRKYKVNQWHWLIWSWNPWFNIWPGLNDSKANFQDLTNLWFFKVIVRMGPFCSH